MAIEYIKILYRFLRYKAEWKKQWREIGIRRKQNQLISEIFTDNIENLIVFLTIGADYVSGEGGITGGMISIISLAEESKKILSPVNHAVICCTKNRDHLLLKFTKFDNQTTIFRFEQLRKKFSRSRNLIIHIPELFVNDFFNSLTPSDLNWISSFDYTHFNILNQNIVLMPEKTAVERLRKIAKKVTITTAHQNYCTKEVSLKYEIPLHKLSVWVSPENYFFTKWNQKENIILFSQDHYKNKDRLVNKIKSELVNYEVIVIRNLSYSEYKKLISKAKFCVTFGEGLDGYFLEPIFSGSISFAVYNELFFTPDFKNLDNLFTSYDELEDKLISKIKKYDDENEYTLVNNAAFEICAKHYSYTEYIKNIELFYKEEYTFKLN